jgi:DNA polymerase IV
MDAFYASIEQRDNPQLRGKPVIVGGDPQSRGVVCTCSYEARKYGVHSAMPSSHAQRLCPQGVFIRPRMTAYRMASAQIRTIFFLYTELVEPLSLDEAYLDVTDNRKNITSATIIAQEILTAINAETGLTASAGVSYNKFLAKVASDINKPNGMTVIIPSQAEEFIATLPIEKFFGIGKVTAKKMRTMGITNGAELKQLDLATMSSTFGKNGAYFYNIVRGVDNRQVEPNRQRKSMGREITLQNDIDDIAEITQIIRELSERVETLLRQANLKGNTVTLKLKYADFVSVTRAKTLSKPCDDRTVIADTSEELLKKTEAGQRKVRLIGVTVSNFAEKTSASELLFQPELPFNA